ncbi:phage replisome organizer N-terminal domain-containing protein [bacterium]|nr:phage replisome organizer N-terminal domain-containing protein [bacterium]
MAAENKRFYWIQLPITYFNDLQQRKMRKQSNGELMQIIYLKLMLMSCNNNGLIYYEGVYNTLAEEISEAINEDLEMVIAALKYFENNNLMNYQEKDVYFSQAEILTGSETASTRRSRKCRENQKEKELDEAPQNNIKALQCNTNATPMQQEATTM